MCLLHSKRQSLRCSPGQGNPRHCLVMLYVGPRGKSATCSSLCWFWVTSPAIHNQIGPFLFWFLGGWICIHWPLWVSPTNSPVRLGIYPTATSIPTGVFSQRLWGFISLHWNPELWGLSHSPVGPPSLSACECGTTQFASHYLIWSSSHHLAGSPLHRLPISGPPTDLNECFFFNSLVVVLPYSSILCQTVFFVFKFAVVLPSVVWGGTVCLPTPPSWLEVLKWTFDITLLSVLPPDLLNW